MFTAILRWQSSLLITSSISIEYPSTLERVGLEVNSDIDAVSIDQSTFASKFEAPNITVLSNQVIH